MTKTAAQPTTRQVNAAKKAVLAVYPEAHALVMTKGDLMDDVPLTKAAQAAAKKVDHVLILEDDDSDGILAHEKTEAQAWVAAAAKVAKQRAA